MEYSVGQVIYLLNPKSLTIIPALVIEEVTRKTIQNSTKQYVIELPGDEDNVKMFIEEVEEVIFNDVKKLRDYMIENTRKSVEQLINNALTKKDLFFGGSVVDLSSKAKANEVKEIINEKVKNDKHVQKDVKDVIMNGSNNLTKEEK